MKTKIRVTSDPPDYEILGYTFYWRFIRPALNLDGTFKDPALQAEYEAWCQTEEAAKIV